MRTLFENDLPPTPMDNRMALMVTLLNQMVDAESLSRQALHQLKLALDNPSEMLGHVELAMVYLAVSHGEKPNDLWSKTYDLQATLTNLKGDSQFQESDLRPCEGFGSNSGGIPKYSSWDPLEMEMIYHVNTKSVQNPRTGEVYHYPGPKE